MANKTTTLENIAGNGAAGLSDNDAKIINGIPQISVTAGDYGITNHNLDFGFKPSIVLPIKITNFTAIPNANTVNVQWVVSEQVNIASYEVEVSSDGIHFSSIATVLANNNQTAIYNGADYKPLVGINYYRIKSIEKNGAITYSDIRKITFGKQAAISIYPNPAYAPTISLSLTSSMTNTAATITITSTEGKLVSTKNITKTNQTEILNISNLASGFYIVTVATNNDISNTKLEIVK